MLNLYLRFMLQFSSIIYEIFSLTISDNSLNQCQSGWHYFSEETLCIIFARSHLGDISWSNSSKACETNSAELLIISNRKKINFLENKIHENKKYLDHFRRGTWIGKAKWSIDDLCDNSTNDDDLQFNCLILTIRLNDQSLCLKKVSCEENHPFICQNTAITENELVENTMERVSWWKCFALLWCLMEDTKEANEEKKNQATKAAKAAEIQNFINQFDFNTPDETETNIVNQPAPMAKSSGNQLISSDSESSNLLFIIGGGAILLLIIFICCGASIYAYMKIKNRRLTQRNGSFDSTYST